MMGWRSTFAPQDIIHFIAIGPGPGGIEHLNLSGHRVFSGDRFDGDREELRWLSFLAHEYFSSL